MPEVEAICRRIYEETQQVYADVASELGSAALGFRVLYGPPVVNAPYLFLGYQPGGKEIEKPEHHEGWPDICDYGIAKWPLARKVRSIWGQAVAERSPGLNAIFFRAPDEKAWSKVPRKLREKLEDFSLERAKGIIDALQPQHVVVIGFKTFDRLVPTSDVVLCRGKGQRLAAEGTLWGRRATGTVHLSGAQMSNIDRDRLAAHFKMNG